MARRRSTTSRGSGGSAFFSDCSSSEFAGRVSREQASLNEA